MTDLIGALEIPVPVPDQGKTVADPFLDLFGEFLRAAINADTKDAWAAVHPAVIKPHGEPLPVTVVHRHNPDEAKFRSNELPALFVWRNASGKRLRISQDWQVVPTTIQVLWVPPRAQQKPLAERQPFSHAVASSVDRALDGGRHKAWIVTGDPDPNAATRGSYFYRFAKLFEEPVITSTKCFELKLARFDSTRETDNFDCFLMELEIRELKRPKMDDYALLDHAETGITINDPPLLFNNLLLPASPLIALVDPPLIDIDGSADPVTIIGQGFASGSTVTFGGLQATDVTFIDDTQLQCFPPPHGAGVVDVVVTSPDGTTSGSSGVGKFEYWTTALLALTGSWRNYVTVPFQGTASAGPSGSRSLTAFAGTLVPASTSLSGHGVVRMQMGNPDGSDESILTDLTTTLADYVSAEAWSFAWLLDCVVSKNTSCFWCDTGQWLSIATTATGHRVTQWSDDVTNAFVDVAWDVVGRYVLIQASYDGTILRSRVNGGEWSTAEAAPIGNLTNPIVLALLGVGNTEVDVAELATSKAILDTATFDKIRASLSSRYGIDV